MSDGKTDEIDPEMLENLDLLMNIDVLNEGEENFQLLEDLDEVEKDPPPEQREDEDQ